MRIENYTAEELFGVLNDSDESEALEAKAFSQDSTRSILETVCSFSNEPGMGGGVILIGAAENEDINGPRYQVEEIADPDKAQLDLATQCASVFNIRIRPEIEVERIDGKNVLKVFVPELPAGRKPLYFTKDGIPKGIYRRIGSSDQRCNEEDLPIFYSREDAYDRVPVEGTSIDDVDPEAVRMYKLLRERVRPEAAELVMDTPHLLKALGCIDRSGSGRLNVAGVLLFGTTEVQRQVLPAVRVDYLRVPGTEWVKDPERSFISTELRGSLISVLYRAMDAVRGDLPQGFLLKENDIQAQTVGLPTAALREAIVNALMHRSYRVNRPTQIIRYDNRIEITNAGYSLKPEDELGEAGSEARNPIIADILHEINLAEQKGSGIQRMKRLMEASHLAVPTFESDRGENRFTARLLLHHFLGDEDLKWLRRFSAFNLDDGQKKALIFLRESGAVDNLVYRQLSGEDTLHASNALRALRDFGLITQKGSGKATYYVPGPRLRDDVDSLEGKRDSLQDKHEGLQDKEASLQDKEASLQDNDEVKRVLVGLKKRLKAEVLDGIIVELCRVMPLERSVIAHLIRRDETYVRTILSRLVAAERLRMRYPQMPNHPNQTYTAAK